MNSNKVKLEKIWPSSLSLSLYSTFDYFQKKLNLRYLTGFWVRLCSYSVEDLLSAAFSGKILVEPSFIFPKY